MKKLVEVILAPNDSGVLFSLNSPEQKIGVGGRLSSSEAFKIIEDDSYSELMRGDGVKEREGVIAYIAKTKYEELKKKGEID